MADDDLPVPLPVGTTVDLSVATVAPIRDVAVALADRTYVAVEDHGLWVLQSDGKTIEKVSAPLEALTGVAADGTTYYLITDDGLFAGRDPIWGKVISDMITALCFQLDAPLYLAGAAHGIWRSEDGAQWTPVSFPNVRVIGCAIAGATAYAATTDGVWRSTDSGQTWVKASNPIATRYISGVAVGGGFVYAATGGAGLYVSSDQASTWNRVEGAPLALEDVSVGSGVLSVWGDGMLLQSADAGVSWTSTPVAGADNLNGVALLKSVGAR